MGIFDLGLLEIFLVCVGISFDVLALSICYGAVILKVEKAQLLKIIGIFTLCQTAGVMLGEMVSAIPLFRERSADAGIMSNACSIAILIVLGVILLLKGWKQDDTVERRSEIDFKKIWISALLTSVDSLFAGFSFALWSVNQIEVFVCVVLVTAIAVIAGIRLGYHLGWEPKKIAYYIGAAILLVSAIDVFVRLLAQ
ncbi:MAG: hypothetical protein E7546_01215 [Ruminococcaceae bacterium]|nr:hypothetical protein [Oscillospiraceae bacterium]